MNTHTLAVVGLTLLLGPVLGCGASSAAPARQESTRDDQTETDTDTEGTEGSAPGYANPVEPDGVAPTGGDGDGWNSPTAPYDDGDENED